MYAVSSFSIFFFFCNAVLGHQQYTSPEVLTLDNERITFHTDAVVTYAEAEAICANSSSHVLTIRTAEKQSAIQNYIFTKVPRVNLWPSLSYSVLSMNGFWFHYFDTEIGYTNWFPSRHTSAECEHISGLYFYLVVFPNLQPFGKWFHTDCSAKMFAVCEKPIRSWYVWSGWSECSKSCGEGTQTRTRKCKLGEDHEPCHGEAEQVQSCNETACNVQNDDTSSYTAWSGWGSCNQLCGVGMQKRFRYELTSGHYQMDFDSKSCIGSQCD